jgi:F0F1-type ATP synthase assembly protein I
MVSHAAKGKPTRKTRFSMMIVGIIIGSVIGWMMFDSLSIGIAFGLPIGLVFGMAFASTSTEHEGTKREKPDKK